MLGPGLVSVDDHVIEPPTLWWDRLPRDVRELGPHVVRRRMRIDAGGGNVRFVEDPEAPEVDCWSYEGRVAPLNRLIACAGEDDATRVLVPISFDEMRPGCHDPRARLADMDLGGIAASLCFPTFPRFCGQTFNDAGDKDVAHRCVQVYNDWMVEDWSGSSGGRLVPLCIVPLWNVDAAVAEVRRNAERGVRAVTFSEIPAYLGLPSIHSGYWDPLFAVCEATDTTLCLHIGSSSRYMGTSPDSPDAVTSSADFVYTAMSLLDFLFSGVLIRHPRLRLLYAEGQVGWMPYVLERADNIWGHGAPWTGVEGVTERPSDQFRRAVYGCCFQDRHGMESLDAIGEDNVTIETDYPHTDSTWPNSQQVVDEMTVGLSPEVKLKVTRLNAMRVLGH